MQLVVNGLGYSRGAFRFKRGKTGVEQGTGKIGEVSATSRTSSDRWGHLRDRGRVHPLRTGYMFPMRGSYKKIFRRTGWELEGAVERGSEEGEQC